MESPAWADLAGAFTRAGLPLPPIPGRLRLQLRTMGRWCWSTRPIDPVEMYLFDGHFGDVLRADGADYAALSHSGYGTNSYGLNFHLVHDRLAVMMQVEWGGAYTDNARAANDLAGYWARVSHLLDTPPASSVPPEWWLLVVFSDFRGASDCSWITRSATGYDRVPGLRAISGANPFDEAVRLWAG